MTCSYCDSTGVKDGKVCPICQGKSSKADGVGWGAE